MMNAHKFNQKLKVLLATVLLAVMVFVPQVVFGQENRISIVTGELTDAGDGNYLVNGYLIVVTADTLMGEVEIGDHVIVVGELQADGATLNALSIEPMEEECDPEGRLTPECQPDEEPLFTTTGELGDGGDGNYLVNGYLIVVTPETVIGDGVEIGDTVVVTGELQGTTVIAASIIPVDDCDDTSLSGSECLPDDDDEDDEDDEDDDNTGACARDDHPAGLRIAEQYDVSYEDVMALFCDGYGFGEIVIALTLADGDEDKLQEILDERESGKGWGKIKKQFANDDSDEEMTPFLTERGPKGKGEGKGKGKGNGNGNGNNGGGNGNGNNGNGRGNGNNGNGNGNNGNGGKGGKK